MKPTRPCADCGTALSPKSKPQVRKCRPCAQKDARVRWDKQYKTLEHAYETKTLRRL